MEDQHQTAETDITPVDTLSRAKLDILMPRLHYMLLFFGLLLVFITPPLQTPDEDSHLVRSIMVAEGHFFPRYDGERWGQDVPESLVQYVQNHKPLMTDASQRYSYGGWFAFAADHTPHEPTVFHSYSAQSSSPLLYLPQAAGIWAGKALYAVSPGVFNWAAAQYFARIGNLVAFVLGIGLAIRLVPQFSSSLAFLALTPMTLSLAASTSYDVTVILVAVGYFAAIMSAIHRAEIGWKHWIAIFGLSFLLGHCKMVYAPMMLALFVLFSRLGWQNFLKVAGISGVSALAGIFVGTVVFGVPSDASANAVIQEQVDYVGGHLFGVPGLLLRTLGHSIDFYYISSLGILGWLNAHFPLPVITAWFGVGLAAIVADIPRTKSRTMLLFAAYSIAGAILSVSLLMLVMYIIWTSQTVGIGAPLVEGVQGRYLLPVFPFLFASAAILLSTFVPVRERVALAIVRHQLTLGAAMLSLTVFMIIIRYWVPVPA